MKKSLKFLPVALLATMAMVVSSCDDDNEPGSGAGSGSNSGATIGKVNPKKVFPYGVPSQIDEYEIFINSKGIVTEIINGDEVTTFDYSGSSKAASFAVPKVPSKYDMIISSEEDDDMDIFYVRLNNMGFISYAYGISIDSEDDYYDYTPEEWNFKYDKEGHLIEMKCTEDGDTEVTTFTYEDGDLTDVVTRYDDEDTQTKSIYYTDSANPAPITNKSGLILYDYSLHVDMGKLELAFYAGLLGKGTAHLPLMVQSVYESSDYNSTDTYTLTWDLDIYDMPSRFKFREQHGWGDTIYIRWHND